MTTKGSHETLGRGPTCQSERAKERDPHEPQEALGGNTNAKHLSSFAARCTRARCPTFTPRSTRAQKKAEVYLNTHMNGVLLSPHHQASAKKTEKETPATCASSIPATPWFHTSNRWNAPSTNPFHPRVVPLTINPRPPAYAWQGITRRKQASNKNRQELARHLSSLPSEPVSPAVGMQKTRRLTPPPPPGSISQTRSSRHTRKANECTTARSSSYYSLQRRKTIEVPFCAVGRIRR